MKNSLAILLTLSFCSILNASVMHVGDSHPYHSLTSAVEAALPFDSVIIHGGVYREGTIEINRPIYLLGRNNPVLDGEMEHAILVVRADSVIVSGITFQNVGISYVEDKSAVRLINSENSLVENNRLINSFFGIYLEKSNSCIIRNNIVEGSAVHEMNSGNAIHLWYCKNILVSNNEITGHRDGIYLEFVDNSLVENNRVYHNLRYGLHFMFSDNDHYYKNHFSYNGAGVAVMFSREIHMEENDFSENWGSSSYGLLLKDITDSEILRNYFSKNTIGIYAEGVNRTLIEHNDFEQNGWAMKVLGSCSGNTISANNFLNNSFDISTNSSRNDNEYSGNFWSANIGSYDLDRDGISDVPYRPVKLLSYMIDNMQASTILMRSLLIDIINHAERVAPAITPHNLLDNEPVMRRIEHD